MGSRNIETREDYDAMVEKYAARLKVAQAKFDEYKREVDVLKKALDARIPAHATEAQKKQYDSMTRGALGSMRDVDRTISEMDDNFDRWVRLLKLMRR